MSKKFLVIAPLAAAIALAFAPIAGAEDHLECSNPSGNNTVCQTPGNAQITPSTNPNTSFPGYGWPYQYGPVIVWGGLNGNGSGGHSGGTGPGPGGGGHR
jgi:hypothetical protein